MAETKKEALSKLYFLRAMMSKMATVSDEVLTHQEELDRLDTEISSKKDHAELLKKNQELFEKSSSQESFDYDFEKEDKLFEERIAMEQICGTTYFPEKGSCFMGKGEKEGEYNYYPKSEGSEKENIAREIGVFKTNFSRLKFNMDHPTSNSEVLTYVLSHIVFPITLALGLVISTIFFFRIWLLILTIATTIGTLIYFCVEMPFWTVNESWVTSKNIERKRKDLSRIEDRIKELEEKLCNIKAEERTKKQEEMKRAKEDQDRALLANEIQINEALTGIQILKSSSNEVRKKMDGILKNSREMYSLAKRNTENFIDERDWENLDIIIYELETGRADTMKEALQQADYYNRHNEMIEAIETAGRAISASISQNINDLKHSIGLQVKTLRADINELNESQRAIEGKLGDMLDAQELSNALLEKANESSKDLAENIEYIKGIKYREYYGIEHL